MDRPDPETLLLPFEDASSTRRGFLRLVGFGLAGGALSACSRGPVRYVVPALAPSPGVVPGRAYRIATTCGGCEAGCGVLARCRDGRPIQLEGLPEHPISRGGLCPAGQASVLPLYDSHRIDGPLRAGEPATWEEADAALRAAFEGIERGGRLRLLTGTLHGPSTRAAVARFLARFPDARHVEYDGLSASAQLDAHDLAFGARVLPFTRLERARTVVSFGADFLSTWISPVGFTAGYAAGRSPQGPSPRMSRHYQLEARTSLTGCRADERGRLAPHETAAAMAGLCALLEARAGGAALLAGAEESTPQAALLERAAADLWESRGESLVLAGEDDLEVQLLACYANHLIGSYGRTLDLERASQQRQGDDRALAALAAELATGTVDALIVQGVNPAYDLAGALPVEHAGLLVSCAGWRDETARLAGWVLPEPHALEAWDDGEPREGTLVLTQPTVPALRSTRSLRESLSRWCGDGRSDRDLVRDHWREHVFPRQSRVSDFGAFFDGALQEGWVELPDGARAAPAFRREAVRAPVPRTAPADGALALVLYPKAGILDGRHAENPWLQELPDPVSKVVWDNYACLSPEAARRLSLAEGDVVRVSLLEGGAAVELPVHVQAGQHDGVVAVALGYGRAGTERFSGVGPDWIQARPTVGPGGVVGSSAGPLVELGALGRRFEGRAVALEAVGRSVELAVTQDHHSLAVPEHLAIRGHETRDAVLSTTLAHLAEDPAAAVHGAHAAAGDLWPEDHPLAVRWGMAVDLARCTGCSACVVACQSENNVPVVGRDEVLRHREMSWIRIDRYYSGEGDSLRAVHQPMMCQHCDHAPCEAVCPVLATVHSSEGLNQQVYNRCVGTRYCANTCPYKVRRFNWFDYPREDRLQNHALNPDVTVRSRGVMEKCSFCVQRIQEAKGEAKREGRAVRDGDVRTACQQSCPAEAIVFGDLNDAQSRVARLGASPRAYGVLEELNVQPSVRYLAHVSNPGRGEHDER